jgi:hypothetical protein
MGIYLSLSLTFQGLSVKRLPFAWIIAALLLSLSALPLVSYPQTPIVVSIIAWIIVALAWVFVLLLIASPQKMQKAGGRLNELRMVPAVALLLSFMLLLVMVMLWGIIILPEFSLFTMVFYFFLLGLLWGWGSTPSARARIGTAFEGNVAANSLITLLSVVMIFTLVELTMRFTTIYPDGFAVTLQFTTWYDRYYKPINSLERRGYEPRSPLEEQESILVIGDSYAAGHGINDVEKLFAYQLEAILGDEYLVNLNAHIGQSPSVESFVSNYPVQPDILIISHFINDIEHEGIPGIGTYQEFAPNPLTAWFTSRYFLFSFAYWHYYAGPRMVSSYADELLAAYDDADKWAAHQARLQEFIDWGKANDVPIIVLVWPTLNELSLSTAANARVIDLFESQGATVVDLAPLLEPLRVEERILNDFDAHPSEGIQGPVAEALAEAVRGLEQADS